MSRFAICTVSAAAVRKEDTHRSEMTNQLLFGETMEVLNQKGEWVQIRSLYDNYEGWLTEHLIEEISPDTAAEKINYVTTGLLNPLTLPDELVNLPLGSSLTGYDEETRLLWDEDYKYHGTYRNINDPFDIDLLWKTMLVWINSPYQWGGRTFMGVDCSGFVQVVFKVMGIPMLRDAYQQATQGTELTSLQEVKTGDLAFFQNEQGRVTHVGILLGNDQIIHASGKVRIDKIDADGIINRGHGRRTHKLHSLRRLF